MKDRRLRIIIILISFLTFCLSVYAFMQGYRDGQALRQQKLQEQTKEVAK